MSKILVVTITGKIFSNLTQVSRTDLLNAAAYPCCTLKAREKYGPEKKCFFHAGPHFTDTTGGGFCKHFGW